MNHFTPFGAQVEPPPAMPARRRPRLSYTFVAIVWCLSWIAAVLSSANLAYQTYHVVKVYDQQLAWDARR